MRGDVDCDGKVTSGDALLILQLNVGFIADLACVKNADVNCDNRINAVDAALILQFDVGFIDNLDDLCVASQASAVPMEEAALVVAATRYNTLA